MELVSVQLESLIALLGLCIFAVITWKNIRYGIYTILAVLPIYTIRPTLFSLPTTLLELLVLILFVCWILKEQRWKRINVTLKKENTVNLIPTPFRLPLILLLISALISMIVAATPAAFGIFKAYFFEATLFFIVFVYEIKDATHMKHALYALGIPVIAIGIAGLVQAWTGIGIPNEFWAAEATRRTTTFFGYPNAQSLFVGPIVALYAGYLLTRPKHWELLYCATVIALGLIAVITAKTAGALLALTLIGIIMLITFKKTRSLGIGLVTITLTMLLHTYLTTPELQTTAHNIQNNILDLDSSSLEIRINQWRETGLLILDQPFLGAGLSGYQTALIPYHQYDFLEIFLYPHNIFLNFWVELGILGLIAVVWMGVVIIRTIVFALHPKHESLNFSSWGYMLMLAWLVVLIHGLVDVPYFKNDLSILWMTLFAMTAIVYRWDHGSAEHISIKNIIKKLYSFSK